MPVQGLSHRESAGVRGVLEHAPRDQGKPEETGTTARCCVLLFGGGGEAVPESGIPGLPAPSFQVCSIPAPLQELSSPGSGPW